MELLRCLDDRFAILSAGRIEVVEGRNEMKFIIFRRRPMECVHVCQICEPNALPCRRRRGFRNRCFRFVVGVTEAKRANRRIFLALQ